MPGGGETRETYRFADDDDSDDLGGFGRGKRSYEEDDDDEDGGWAINEVSIMALLYMHSDCFYFLLLQKAG